ncbi:adenosine deaminase [Streptomyces sp. AF1A]|jgi:adenosine deaminase|uniref:adenosine deaminase n=1 Tax=Streptomyces sp. AF1A TaxID=3394350 RepID=UPI0039BD0D0B
MTLTTDDLRALPKAHLHLHLEGALRRETARELAERYGLPLLDTGPYADQAGFVAAYESARDLVRSLDDLARVAREIVEDAAATGVVWTELYHVPFSYTGRLGAAEGVVEAVLDGLDQGTRATGCGAGLILAHNRARPLADATATAAIARRHAGRGIVGFGLAGNEAAYPAALFREVFASLKDSGLLLVPHAGEGAGAESVRSAWRDLGADRISHGISAVADPALVRLLAEHRICLDVCPTSNVRLGAAPSLAEHPLPRLLAAGVPVSLGSDCPAFFGVDIIDEYRAAHRDMGLTARQLAGMARDSLRCSAAPDGIRAAALEALANWTAAHTARG